MAKINELTDSQLEKAYIQYSVSHKQNPSEKSAMIVQQIQAERLKRQSASPKAEESALSQLSKTAEASLRKKSIPKAKPQKKGGIQFQSRQNTGSEAKISLPLSNILIGCGCTLGAVGLILFFDIFISQLLPIFNYNITLALILLAGGITMAKISTFLSDDNT